MRVHLVSPATASSLSVDAFYPPSPHQHFTVGDWMFIGFVVCFSPILQLVILFFMFPFLQIKTISWLWFRIQLNKPLSWLPASFLNLMPLKNNSVNHVHWRARGRHIGALPGWSVTQWAAAPPPTSFLASCLWFPGRRIMSRFWSKSLWEAQAPFPSDFVALGKGSFSLTKNNQNA